MGWGIAVAAFLVQPTLPIGDRRRKYTSTLGVLSLLQILGPLLVD
jgi:hypothetical protein